MELSKVGNKINSAGKNKQCTIQAKDIRIDTISKSRVEVQKLCEHGEEY